MNSFFFKYIRGFDFGKPQEFKMAGSKKTTKNQTKGNFWVVKVTKALKVLISVIVAEINILFKHKTPN